MESFPTCSDAAARFRAVADEAQTPGEVRESRHGYVPLDAVAENKALSFRFLRHETDARAMASSGERNRTASPSRRTVPSAFFMPKSAFHHLRAARTDKPEEAEDLTGAHVEGHVVKLAFARQPVDCKDRAPSAATWCIGGG